jgi:uncharacterized protein (DUF1501 family)
MENFDKNHINRRKFLASTSCAAMGSTSLLSTLTNLLFTQNAVAQNANNFTDYKALICFFMPGGNDSFNLLVPTTGTPYTDYAAVRGDLAIPQNNLLPLSTANNAPGATPLGLHPDASGLQELYNMGKLAFVANVGTLVRPTSMAEYNNGIQLPERLYSHADQADQWQTSIPQSRSATGWAGRTADLLQGANRSSAVSMNIALGGGSNLWQVGNQVVPYNVYWYGATQLNEYNMHGENAFYKVAVDNQLSQDYKHVLQKHYATTKRNALEASAFYNSAINLSLPADTMGNNDLAEDLRQIAKTIAARNTLGVKRQIFYVQWNSWDFHDDVITQMNDRIPIVSQCLRGFYDLLVAMGVQNNVTTFTASDFGRSLTSNAKGSDHAWGGNQLVMGGAVSGGRIIGSYPELYLGGPLETGRGRFIPSTSVDQLAAELAIWLGVSKSDLPIILPNIGNFYNINSSSNPLGFMV